MCLLGHVFSFSIRWRTEHTLPYGLVNMNKKAPRHVERSLLGKEQWVEAAVKALVEGGLSAVAIEPIADALGVTKGSFYWHFENRAALVAALVARWEKVGTEDLIAQLDHIADPRARLVMLLDVSFDDVARLRAEASLGAAAAAGDPVVRPVVARVMQRRLSYMTTLYKALGVTKGEAARLAVVAYGAYLGCVQLAAHGLVGSGDRALRKQVATLRDVLLPHDPSRLRS
jgi:AcrR family transcriptional regulator